MVRLALGVLLGLLFGVVMQAHADSLWGTFSTPNERLAYVTGFADAMHAVEQTINGRPMQTDEQFRQSLFDLVMAGDCADHLAGVQLERFLDQPAGDGLALVQSLMHCKTSIQ